jgi:YD repeat-containing protein
MKAETLERRIKRILVLSSLLFINCFTFAQSPLINKFLPVLAPSSPEAAAFTKYGNYQVNLFTGIPDISIPLYEIKIGELNVPISINYHSSGIKVNEMASRVGLGWDLQSGGSITRKIMGKPDELDGNYLSQTSTSTARVMSNSEINHTTEAGLEYLNNVDQGNYDVEPDIFSYSFPGHSGKFLFNQRNNYTPILIPVAPVAVSMTKVTNAIKLSITDESGIVYKFDSTEWTSSGGGISVDATSAWLLTDMISANKQDTVHLRYATSGGGITDQYFSDYATLDDNCVGFPTPQQSTSSDVGSVNTLWKQLTEIDFKNGKVVFEGAPESRQDFSGAYSLQHRLNSIKIYSYDALSNTYNLLRSIQFFQSYFITGTDASTKRLRLDSLQISTASGTTVETYKFNYNTAVGLPNNLSRMKDYWGYFNNQTNISPISGFPTMVAKMDVQYLSPNNPTTTWSIGGNNYNARICDPYYMQADILQQITYPTGGYTQFMYETNQYRDANNNPQYAGGLRIKSIKNYASSTSTPIIKTYNYGVNESGYGRNNFLMEQYFFTSTQNIQAWNNKDPNGFCGTEQTKRTRTFFANPTNDLEGYDGASVVYSTVTEYDGDSTTNSGKTVYTFSDTSDVRTDIIGYGKPILTSYHFLRGLLINRSDYKNNGNGTYTKVQEDRKKYQYFPLQWSTGGIGLVVYKTLITLIGGNPVFLGLSGGNDCSGPVSDANNYMYNNYDIVSGDNKVITDTLINYDQSNPAQSVSTITNYSYDDVAHLQTTQSQTINSRGESIITSFKYPYNYSTAPYTNMTSAHIYDKIVQQTVTNNGATETIQTNNYGSFSGTNYLPANIQLQVKTNAAETRALFNQYDNRGNIVEMQKPGDIKQSFIWDYSNIYPVAQVINAAESDIAYTSFESDGKGNWAFSGTPIISATCPTGHRAYNLSNGSIYPTYALSTSKTYIVSYWSNSGPQNVNNVTATAGRVVNGWTYYEHQVVNPLNGNLTVSGTGTIDELRLYPSGALMTSYSYDPLIGLTAQCDANNRFTYYEYDGLGRLALIRDQDKNVLKKFCYNYAGQPEACSYFFNAYQSQTFTRNNCGSGYNGSQVTYSVPANTYGSSVSQSDADAKALAEIAANGQAYANTNGTCTAPLVTVQGYNSRSSNYNLRFTNNSTGTSYYFTLYANTYSASTLGQVPSGTYTVVFYPAGPTVTCTFYINGYTYYGTGATFNNISITSTSTAKMY